MNRSTLDAPAPHSETSQVTDIEAKVENTIFCGFDISAIRKYPKSNRKIRLHYGPYNLAVGEGALEEGQSIHIAPGGIEFHSQTAFDDGMLLKIHVNIPDYWQRKRRFVEYRRVDQPARFPILAKVVRTEETGRRGKKKIVTVQTVNIDETDELVLKSYLQEG